MEEQETERYPYAAITTYLQSGIYPPDADKKEKRGLRKRAKYFVLFGGKLHYVGGNEKNTPRLVVEDKEEQRKIIECIHGQAHLGRDKTLSQLNQRYYWPNMYKTACAHIASCDHCQRQNHKLHKTNAALHPIPIKEEAWYQVGMDLVGPLAVTPTGNKFLMTITDYYTKWAVAAALKDKSASSVANVLYSVFCTYGCPTVILSDQGREFVNKVTEGLFKKTNTQHRITYAYHPQTNGLTERFNQTLCRSLSKLVNQAHDDWDTKLETVLFAYRVSRHRSTGYSPFFMMFHRQPRLPIEADLEIETDLTGKDLDPETTADAFIEIMLKRQEDIKSVAGENIKTAQKKQKEGYDKRHSPEELQPGTKVMVENTQQKERKGGKFENKYSGPYIIHTSEGKGVYTLKALDGKVLKKKCNMKRLKVYINPSLLVEHSHKAPNGPTPLEKPTGPTQPEDPNGLTPLEKPTGPTQREDPNGPTPPEKPTGSTQPEDPNGPTPPEKPTGSTQPEDPNGSTTPEKPTGPTQREDPNGLTPPENPPGLLSVYNPSDVTLMAKCLFDDSLLRLYRTGACTHLYRSEEDDDFDLSYLYQDEHDYALSMDTNVALWQTYRAYAHQPEVVEAFDFVIVNSLLHNQFDDFKKAEKIDVGISYLEMNSLLHFYIRQHPQLGTSLTEKYGKTYMIFTCDQVDELCQWIYTMREQHTDSELSKLSHTEGPVELQLTHLQPTKPLDPPPSKRRKYNQSSPPCPGSRKTKRGKYAGSLWIPDLDLRYRDRGVVKRGLLCDRHMYAAHELLRYQFPHLHGLQSTLLSQREFRTIHCHDSVVEAIQILFVKERQHWVVSSFTNGKLRLYDSCSTGGLTSSLEVQLAQIYGNQFAVNSKLKVHIEPVQQQEGGMDCGVFSIANAYNAAMGKSAKDIAYDSQQMRSHLQHCFEAKELSTFPQSQNSAAIIRCDPKEVTIELYCTCGLPETFDSQMVLCAECQKWFHFKCMKIKDIPRGRWLCITCKN